MPDSWRTLHLSPRYLRAVARLGLKPGTVRGAALGRTLRALATAEVLPSPIDVRAVMPPVAEAHVRRVGGHNVWVWYRAAEGAIVLVTVTTEPPTPIVEDE